MKFIFSFSFLLLFPLSILAKKALRMEENAPQENACYSYASLHHIHTEEYSCYTTENCNWAESFFFIPLDHLSFDEARIACEQLGGRLAEPKKKKHLQLVECLTQKVQQNPFWIGLVGTPTTDGITYTWLDGSLFNRTVVNTTDDDVITMCVGIENPEWRIYPCQRASRYVCEYNFNPRTTGAISTTATSSILADKSQQTEEPDRRLREALESECSSPPVGASTDELVRRTMRGIHIASTQFDRISAETGEVPPPQQVEGTGFTVRIESRTREQLSPPPEGATLETMFRLDDFGVSLISLSHPPPIEDDDDVTNATFKVVTSEFQVASLGNWSMELADNEEHVLPDTKKKILDISVFDGNGTAHDANVKFSVSLGGDSTVERISNELESGVKVAKFTPVCTFLNITSNKVSRSGCVTSFHPCNHTVLCECNHTTIFAVILSIKTVESITDKIRNLQYVIESVSVACLSLTFYILVTVRRKIRSDRTVLQINLVVSLLLFHLFQLFHDLVFQNNRACEVSAILSHFFLLSSGGWMFAEGMTLLMKTCVKSLPFKNPKMSLKCAVGWGIPAIISIATALVGFCQGSYMRWTKEYQKAFDCNPDVSGDVQKYDHCFLNQGSGLLYIVSVPVPLCVVILLNLIITVQVGRRVYKLSKKSANQITFQDPHGDYTVKRDIQPVVSGLRAVVLLVPILGLPWIFGVLVGLPDAQSSKIFMYLNVIVNGLQGLFLFGLYCLNTTEVRRILAKMWRDSQEERKAATMSLSTRRHSKADTRNTIVHSRQRSQHTTPQKKVSTCGHHTTPQKKVSTCGHHNIQQKHDTCGHHNIQQKHDTCHHKQKHVATISVDTCHQCR